MTNFANELENSDLSKSLSMIEEIVLTAEMVEFYRKDPKHYHFEVNFNRELNDLRDKIKEWREWCKT